jgi:hypothetical protein
MSKRLHIAIPLLRESNQILSLLENIQAQTNTHFRVYFCINQPDHWWEDPVYIQDCIDNAKTHRIINETANFDFEIIDKFSKGNGWERKKSGVGWARKVLYDRIIQSADPDDVIISLDADTRFSPSYFQSISDIFQSFPSKSAICIPYYHRLTGDEVLDRNILRYEIYLRSYFLNLSLIGSPYAFTAIGSAMAFPVWAYRKTGGMKPYESGEDFYLMQKFKKSGEIMQCLSQSVYPSARFSDRVPFGTGPAMIEGANGNWSKYPVFRKESFEKIQQFYHLLPLLFLRDTESPLDSFFQFRFGSTGLWSGIRKNSKTQKQFIKKVHQKFDGLRILQFLRFDQDEKSDEMHFEELYQTLFPAENFRKSPLSFQKSSVSFLDTIRNNLYHYENEIRCQNKI